MELKAQIINLEKSLLTLEVRSSKERLCKLIASEFKEIGASGAYFGRDSILERLPTERNWTATVQDFEFSVLAPEICQLVFRAFIRSNNTDEGTYSLRSSLWRKYDDGWKMVFHQGTKVAPFEISLQKS